MSRWSVVVAGLIAAAWLLWWVVSKRRSRTTLPSDRRILLPFAGRDLSQSALDATLRLARSENATLIPAYLMVVPMNLPLEAALPKQSAVALPIIEAVEQRAAAAGVPVESRLERGRGRRHALRQLIEHESFDRIVVPASSRKEEIGLTPSEVAWLLRNAPGEIIAIRPDSNNPITQKQAHWSSS